MKIVHTSDWHVGKTLRGRSRADEHRAALTEIAEIARQEQADLVIVAGDLFDSAAPTAESENIVYRALLDLSSTGARVAIVAGNHDNERRLQAVQPLLELGSVVTRAVAAEGLVTFTSNDGEPASLALLPWVPKHQIEKVEHVLSLDPSELLQHYAERVKRIIERLCGPMTGDAVNILAAHMSMPLDDPGEEVRQAHLFDYAVSAAAFPASLHYVALGHYHRPIDVGGPCPIHYCGSPLWLGFPRQEHEAGDKGINIIEATPGKPAQIRFRPLTSGRRFRTLRGSLAELEQQAGAYGEDYLRIFVRDQARAGVAQQVREWFPHCVDVSMDTSFMNDDPDERPSRAGKSPKELFHDYLTERNAVDERVEALFDSLLQEAYAPDPA